MNNLAPMRNCPGVQGYLNWSISLYVVHVNRMCHLIVALPESPLMTNMRPSYNNGMKLKPHSMPLRSCLIYKRNKQ